MARQIIIIKALDSAPDFGFRFALWAVVPSARQLHYANAQATSEVVDATAPELSAIQNGSVTEKIEEARWPAGTTIAQVQAFLVTRFNVFQTQISAYNPWQRTGTSYDGTSWNVTNNG